MMPKYKMKIQYFLPSPSIPTPCVLEFRGSHQQRFLWTKGTEVSLEIFGQPQQMTQVSGEELSVRFSLAFKFMKNLFKTPHTHMNAYTSSHLHTFHL